MTSLVQQSTTQLALKFFLVLSSDHISPATGLSPTVTISKEGGAFATPSGAVSEIANGWYKVAANATDTNTLGDILLHASVATADNYDGVVANVVAFNPQNANIGISFPTNFSSLSIDSNGNVSLKSNVKKNTALNDFPFTMTDSTNHAPIAGKTVTAQRSLDGAAFAACANSVVELSNGDYTINLAAADMNANTIMLRFTSVGADDLNIIVVTDP